MPLQLKTVLSRLSSGKRSTLLALSMAALLLTTACTPPQEAKVGLAFPDVPEVLLTCPEAPQPPAARATQRDVALYTTQLHAAHGECYGNLRSVKIVLAKAKERFDAVQGTTVRSDGSATNKTGDNIDLFGMFPRLF